MPDAFADSLLLLFVLLNPFLMSIYLLDLIEGLEAGVFRNVLVRGTFIAGAVFILFAGAGDAVFSSVLQVRFSAFLIFGGVVFLIVAVRYVMQGSEAIRDLRGPPEHLAGSIAMPFMIGPGTVSASILAGSRQPFLWAALAVVAALTLTVIGVILLKLLHDFVKTSNESLVRRYIDVVGRVSAFVIGTIAIEMILKGVDLWLNRPDSVT
ncbi:MAG: MarC family protein [Planctomycetes bacterium]|nr:MarC family protein [Planctomycetota bacterium]